MDFTQIGTWLLNILGWSLGGIVAVMLARYAYRLITPFDVTKELVEDRNTAVGVSKGLFMVASAIILHGIVVGDKLADSLAVEVALVILYYLLGLLLLGLGRIMLVVTTRYDFNEQIHVKDNLAVGMVEGCMYIAFAIAIHSAL